MSCLIKNIPDSAKVLYGTGNKGLFFPLVPICATIAQPDAPPVVDDFCYLAVELGNFPVVETGDCVQKHCLDWSWQSRKCSVSDLDVKWKDTKSIETYAKKWKYEAGVDCEEAFNDEILLELLNPVSEGDYRISAPCVGEEEFCYIALQEDGITSIDKEETDEVFLTDCIA